MSDASCPSPRSNPALCVCDSDALVQIFLSNELTPLRVLKDDYGVQPVIVDEVSVELRSLRKFNIAPKLTKALSSGLVAHLDPATVARCLGAPPVSVLNATLGAVATLGSQYSLFVHGGEAFTHAAAVTLSVPSLSHDENALAALRVKGLQLPSTVLRLYDLLALCYSREKLTANECDAVKGNLRRLGEGVKPPSFYNNSFEHSLQLSDPLLYDADLLLASLPPADNLRGAPIALFRSSTVRVA